MAAIGHIGKQRQEQKRQKDIVQPFSLFPLLPIHYHYNMSQFLLLLLTLAAAYMTPQSLAFLPCWNNDRPHNNRPQLSSGEPTGRITSTAAKAMMGVDGYFDSFASRGDNEDNDSNNNEENNGNESGDSNRDNNDSTNRDNNDNDSSSFFLVDYERYKAALEHNTRRTDVRLFLTQRAIQSFIHILIECRDPHTVRWLEVSRYRWIDRWKIHQHHTHDAHKMRTSILTCSLWLCLVMVASFSFCFILSRRRTCIILPIWKSTTVRERLI